jgi:hypothetical protein
VPVLARIAEAAAIPTVVVTMMPEIAERYRLPRVVGVEFPFGHPFGMPHDSMMQRTVGLAALSLYERTDLPARTDVPIVWPVDWKIAYKGWQPREAAPIVTHLKNQVLLKHGKAPQ